METAMHQVGAITDDIAAIGVTTHCETCMIWDRRTGELTHLPGADADAETDRCHRGAMERRLILENAPGVKHRTERGEFVTGTADT
jgi:glycerol kinase